MLQGARASTKVDQERCQEGTQENRNFSADAWGAAFARFGAGCGGDFHRVDRGEVVPRHRAVAHGHSLEHLPVEPAGQMNIVFSL